MINLTRKAALATGAALAMSLALAVDARAEFPEKPIEFVIPFGAGGGADIEGRLLAKEMSKVLGVPLVPVNKKGGGGAVTYTYIKNAKPDGYTIGWNSTSILTTTNIGNVDFKHDAMDHIGRVEYQPQPFVVRTDAKWKTFKDFVADCKANPGKFKVANSGVGSSTHVAAIQLMNAAGCKVIHLPKGIKGRNKSLLNKEADAMVAPLTGAMFVVRPKKARILAIPSDTRNPVIPDVPTAKELGFDASLDLFRGLSVPKGTPDAVKARLADAMTKAAKSAAFMDLAKKKGFTVAPQSYKEFSAMLATEDSKVMGIMQDAGLYGSKKKN